MGFDTFPMFAGGLFFLVWILIMLTFFVGFIMLLVCSWRIMKAHELIAKSISKVTTEKSTNDMVKNTL